MTHNMGHVTQGRNYPFIRRLVELHVGVHEPKGDLPDRTAISGRFGNANMA